MKQFWSRIALLATPFAAFFAVPVYVLVASGELLHVSTIVKLQNSTKQGSLVGIAYSNPVVPYKINRMIDQDAEVVALGTSRVMQFGSISFARPNAFYNAGGGVETLADFRPFLEQIPSSAQPKVLIIGLDQYFFNRAWLLDTLKSPPPSSTDPRDTLGTIIGSSPKIYFDIFTKRHNNILQQLFRPRGDIKRIGLEAFVLHEGFRGDGSFDYGMTLDSSPATRTLDALQRIDQGNLRFQRAKDVDPEAVALVDQLLAYCHSRGIRVIGFLPPYAHVVYVKMKMQSPAYDYLDKIVPSIQPSFDRYGFTLCDFSDLAGLGISDDHVIDGFHGDEEVYKLLLRGLSDRDSALRSYLRTE